jgi:peptidoglycan/xylan/chitin deacetylase (PgdA/CDA1 family)
MSRRSTTLLKGLLSALHFSGADRLVAPLTRGVGAIFTLHHVHAEPPAAFEPNRILRVTPQFLELAIAQICDSGFEIVSLDEAHFRLLEGDCRPFACLTFDDGYRDNLEVAYPIFKRHNLPFAVYICTDFADGRGDLWWLALEKAIGRADSLCLRIDGSERRWRTTNVAEKDAAFHAIYWRLRSIKEDHARALVAELCQATGFDPSGLCAALVMTWDEIRRLAADPLVTIGAHTRRHFALAKLTLPEARDEIAQSLVRIERELGAPCRHLSYPYGDERSAGEREFQLASELAMRTGVTTRKGLIQRRHASALTALPRVSLNGDYQHPRYVKVFLNGAPFAFATRRQRPAAQPAPFH